MKGKKSLEHIHAGFSTPEDIIFDVVRSTTGQQPLQRAKIIAGYDSEVYSVETDNGGVIVKINHHGRIGYKQEAWAMEQASLQGVPVPHVYAIVTAKVDKTPLEFMILEQVEGVSLQDQRTHISSQKFENVLKEAGSILACIHKVHVNGCWRRKDNGKWQYSQWKAVIESMIDGRKSETQFLIEGGLKENYVREILERAKRRVEVQNSLKSVLNHGDFMPEHIYIDDDLNIKGIIDFGDSRAAPNIYDFAFIKLIGPNIPIHALLAGYGDIGVEDPEDEICDLALLIGLGHMSYNVQKKRKPEVEFIKSRILTLFSES